MSQVVGRTNLAFSRIWHVVNVGADSRSLGRLASSIAVTLMGKHKPVYHPSNDCGDYVVAVGCNDLRVTGRKMDHHMYYKHTTRPGKGFKQMNMERLFEKFGGGEILKRAVSGMLPKNRLRDVRLARLKVFEGMDHPYKKNIVVMEARSNRKGPNSARYGPVNRPTKAPQRQEQPEASIS
ncbi:54S ribosomal protein L23, mitochondrial [Orbilia ellipsospora]|uniref:Large ribosomal subunit protein uL13m n=1 Tax=Orbilia ellipsospora TaxID=2528407 RepID=A0AAV9XCP4_9PEZI